MINISERTEFAKLNDSQTHPQPKIMFVWFELDSTNREKVCHGVRQGRSPNVYVFSMTFVLLWDPTYCLITMHVRSVLNLYPALALALPEPLRYIFRKVKLTGASIANVTVTFRYCVWHEMLRRTQPGNRHGKSNQIGEFDCCQITHCPRELEEPW